MERILSEEDSFVLCDSNSPGYPIGYISEGFKKLYGFSAAECAGRSCGEIIGGGRILGEGRSPELLEVADQADLTGDQALEAVKLITSAVRAYVKQEVKVGSALAINRRRSGQLFVCEMEVRRKKHPLLGWSFEAGVQKDISADLSVADLLKAASKGLGELEKLHSRRRSSFLLDSLLDCNRPDEFLHECAGKMWRESVASTTLGTGAPTRRKLRMKAEDSAAEDARSISSLTTACSLTQVPGNKRKKNPSEAPNPNVGYAQPAVFSPGAHHLGGLFGAVQDSESIDSENRFLDLLEVPEGPGKAVSCGKVQEVSASSFSVSKPSLATLNFPFVIADASKPRCPLVWCNQSFLALTCLDLSQALGRDLLSVESISEEVKKAYAALCAAAKLGMFCQKGDLLVDGESAVRIDAAAGELAFTDLAQQTLVFLKQVELDDRMLIIGVLEPFSEAQSAASASETLGQHLDAAVRILASDYFYSAPMRRQVAADAV